MTITKQAVPDRAGLDAAAHTADGVSGHIGPLDGIRALAVMLVILSHTGLGWIIPGGFGVTIFFFLSGYLITTLMRGEQAKTRKVSLPAFYLRRFLRIMPPLWITMLFGIALGIGGTFEIDWIGVAAQFTLVVNYTAAFGHPSGVPYMPLWSLAVEEHYYLVFPLFYVTVLRHLSGRAAAGLCLALCVLVLAGRLAHVVAGTDLGNIYVWSHTRIDSILFGAILALYRNPAIDRDFRGLGPAAAAAGGLLILFTLAVRDPVFRETLRYTLQGVGLYLVFAWVVPSQGLIARILTSQPARFAGLLSYTLYLSHFLLIHLIMTHAPALGPVIGPGVGILLSVVYSVAMYVCVERPLAALRKRLHGAGRRARPGPDTQAAT
jgi:peptidoglycan/LPS O-acetylase OafA/YrhL